MLRTESTKCVCVIASSSRVMRVALSQDADGGVFDGENAIPESGRARLRRRDGGDRRQRAARGRHVGDDAQRHGGLSALRACREVEGALRMVVGEWVPVLGTTALLCWALWPVYEAEADVWPASIAIKMACSSGLSLFAATAMYNWTHRCNMKRALVPPKLAVIARSSVVPVFLAFGFVLYGLIAGGAMQIEQPEWRVVANVGSCAVLKGAVRAAYIAYIVPVMVQNSGDQGQVLSCVAFELFAGLIVRFKHAASHLCHVSVRILVIVRVCVCVCAYVCTQLMCESV